MEDKELQNEIVENNDISEEELNEVSGGSGIGDFFKKIGKGLKDIAKPVIK